MQTYRERLQEAACELSSQYDTIKSEAERRLGTLYNGSDYPSTLDGLFDLEVSYLTIEPPGYLMALHPDVYQAEQARVRERFESAVELAEQAFAAELQRLTAHLAERLTGLHDGQPKVFRDSAVENLREFSETAHSSVSESSANTSTRGSGMRSTCARTAAGAFCQFEQRHLGDHHCLVAVGHGGDQAAGMPDELNVLAATKH
jgi:hypothetical protein